MDDCVPRRILQRLLSESLGDEERARVESHVESCADCQAVLHDLTVGGVLLGTRGALTADPVHSDGPSDFESEAFFDHLKKIQPPAAGDPDPDPNKPDATRATNIHVDGYEILNELGRGAMGVVYRARHLKLDRLVALKIIVAGSHLSVDMRQRFRVEAQAIARLQCPNIVQIYDVGEQGGFPFFSLELVEGGSLAEWMAGKPRPAYQAAGIIATLAEAVQCAHQQGVVHRDLKPANVLLSAAPDPGGRLSDLKITDFGIAKFLPQAGLAEARMTQTGEILGTPAYMAPEQARGNASEISAASDVYSLGAMLYELLTGRPPFQGATPLDTLMQAATKDPVSVSLLVPRVPRDLDTICLKCLEKDAAKRYPTATELAADLGRFLRNEPIRARPLSWLGHGVRWTRRHPGLAASLFGVVFLLVLLTGGSLIASAHFRALEQEQRTLLVEKEKQRGKAVSAERREAELHQQAEDRSAELRQSLYFSQMNLGAQAAVSPSGIGRVSDWLGPWRTSRPDLRHWEWYYLNGLCHRDLMTIPFYSGVTHVAWRPDGKRIAASGSNGVIHILDAATGEELHQLLGHSKETITAAWSGDGKRIASASSDGTVKVWNAETAEELLNFRGHTSDVYTVSWSGDGARLASGGVDQTVQIWDSVTGEVQRVLQTKAAHPAGVLDVQWSPDGRQLASCGNETLIRLWDTATGREIRVLSGHQNFVRGVAWSPDGTRLASASNDQTIKVWDPASGRELLTLRGHALGVASVAWSPDGHRLLSGSDDQTIRLWSGSDGAELLMLRGHLGPVSSVAWAPDGTRLASSSYDNSVKLWSATTSPEVSLLENGQESVNGIAWSTDNRQIATASADKSVRIWDAASATQVQNLVKHTDWVHAVAWSPASDTLASAGNDHTILLQNTLSGEQTGVIHANGDVIRSLAWSPDGHRLASAGYDQMVRIWDPHTGKQMQLCRGHIGFVLSLAWSPDGLVLASSSEDGTVRLWDPSTGDERRKLTGHLEGVRGVVWSPDGRQLASASGDQTLRIWDAATGATLHTLRGHTTRVNSVAWSPDGTRIASGSDDRTVKLWDVATGREAFTLDSHGSIVNAVAWSPDGLTLAVAVQDHEVLLYKTADGYLTERNPQGLPALDRRIRDAPDNVAGWQLRAEIDGRRNDWTEARTEAQHFLDLQPRKHWMTLGYWVVGPYPPDLNASFGPETDTDFGHPSAGAGGSGWASSLDWQFVPAKAAGFLNLGDLYGRAEHISAYAMMRIYSPRQQDVAILSGADDQVRLWLNGRLIHENVLEHAATPDSDAVSAKLVVGWNTLLARVVNLTGAHALYIRLSDEPADLKRVADEAKQAKPKG